MTEEEPKEQTFQVTSQQYLDTIREAYTLGLLHGQQIGEQWREKLSKDHEVV